ncbi:hypothetical protein O3P69_016135 [Scylla paramamosain]|uniref:SURP motif domain-containing protein n=1 Tax=Scylla paramamosain TaxID=85552 RepID=A0AAW0SH57_SCYPA
MAAEYGRSIWESRDKEGNNGHEDLLVFGYSCKLFRDNDKAMYLEKGSHLIPWMGDNSVMVDRYDVRGALYDLSEAESGGGGDRWEGLTEEERAEEERCDYERYLALYHDEFQYQAFQDEEAKRLMAELGSDTYTYSQVGFNYDGQAMAGDMTGVSGEQGSEYLEHYQMQQGEQQQEQQQEQSSGYMPEADEDTYVPPAELNVPQGMVVPETIKQNKIIVKTSKFIVAQGGQMEIIIKTKQADNPMFGFLSFDNPLNAYYKHMVAMIKSGRYTPADEADQVRSRKDSDGNGDQYLHPSLSAGIKPDLAPGTPTSALKPSSDCAYFKLIHKIKEKQKNTTVVESRESPAPASPGVVATSTPVAERSDTPTLEKKVENKATPQPKVKQLVDYPSFNRTRDYDSDSDDGSESSPSASKGASEYSNIKWPPPDVQMVIDKMASYIIKNGVEFETMVRSRDDPRFSFLKKDHEYYPYYRCKIRLYTEVYGDIFKDGVEDKASSLSSLVEGNSSSRKDKRGGNSSSSNSSRSSNNNNGNKQTSTICFSIKSREQDVNLDRHSTFPVESSSSDDEDMDEEEKEKRRLEREERRRKRKIKEKEERERREKEEKERKEREEREKEKEKEKAIEKMEESTDASGDNDDMYDIFKYAQEMDKDMDTEECNHREKVLSEEQGKESSHLPSDGMARSECKQQERRKKAAMFLSRLKKGSREDESTAQPVYGPQLPPEIAAQILNSASQSPRSSLASTRHSTPSRSRSHSASPGPGVPMPPKEAPAPPPPPPPAQSPPAPSGLEMTETYRTNRTETSTNSISKNDWTSIPEPPANTETVEHVKSGTPKESSVLSGASEDGRRSQSLESRRSKSRPIEVPHREKTRSRKKQRHGRSESRSPSSRREHKKRKRSRSRSRRHKKRRSRSRSPKSHKSSHKKKRRKHSSRHEREGRERKSKKSRRRSVSSSSSDSSSHSYSSSRSTSPSDNDVQVIESPGHSKRGSRASSVISVGTTDLSHLSSALGRITEECTSPPLPPIPPSPAAASLLSTVEEKAVNNDSVLEVTGGGGEETKEDKKEEKKPLFDPQNSAAMAKIAQGLRAKVHALLNKESKL